MARDDFSKAVVRTLHERSAHLCNSPLCRRLTVMPHTQPEKVVRVGRACHIHAASPNGPRYKQQQTPEERSSIENGIWLCNQCADVVDRDEDRYPPNLLVEWKQEHEEWVRSGATAAKLPSINLSTLKGLELPEKYGAKIDAEMLDELRQHTFSVTNDSSIAIEAIELRMQLPEPIVGADWKEVPPGASPQFYPDRPSMIVSGSGTATRGRVGPTNILRFNARELMPNQTITLTLISSLREWKARDFEFPGFLARSIADKDNDVHCYVLGTFQFEFRGSMLVRRVFMPISYDASPRNMAGTNVLESTEGYKVLEATISI